MLNLQRRKGGREGRELWPESLTTVVLEQVWPPPRLGNGGEAGFAPREPSAEVGSASAGQEPGSSSGGTVSSLLPGDVCQEEGDRAPSEKSPGPPLPPQPTNLFRGSSAGRGAVTRSTAGWKAVQK